jgi:hypothetical protein
MTESFHNFFGVLLTQNYRFICWIDGRHLLSHIIRKERKTVVSTARLGIEIINCLLYFRSPSRISSKDWTDGLLFFL